MDITPVYELRNRLKAASIAGTNLLQEDFRLKRAAEAIQPLEGASPIFAKISQMVKKLLLPDCADRAGTLLDTITLVDAVLCTQGNVAVSDKIEPLDFINWKDEENVIMDIPYSILKKLVYALTHSGSGHYSFIVDTHKEHPEIFKDYRVKEALVKALDSSYAETAWLAENWLIEDGEAVIPFLKKDFDSKGKKEMVRRINIIEKVAGAKENDFYLQQLPKAEKEVKSGIIYALHHSEENVDVLLDLLKTEKGNQKAVAYSALASLEGEKVISFWSDFMEKAPVKALFYFRCNTKEWASKKIAENMEKLLQPILSSLENSSAEDTGEKTFQLSEKQEEIIDAYLESLPGKSGDKICECYRMAAALKYRLVKLKQKPFKEMVSTALRNALFVCPTKELKELALELYETYKTTIYQKDYLKTAIIAQMLLEGDCSEWLEEQLLDNRKSLTEQKQVFSNPKVTVLKEAISGLRWEEEQKEFVLKSEIADNSIHPIEEYTQTVKQPIEGKLADLLMKCKNEKIDIILQNCICKDNLEFCAKLEDYFYKRALSVKDNRRYITALKSCGASKCSGLAVHYFSNRGMVYQWELMNYLENMPGSGIAKAEETERIYQMAKRKEIRVNGGNIEFLQNVISHFKDQEV